MFNKLIKIGFLTAIVFVACFSFASGAFALTSPQISTTQASSVQSASAVLMANISNMGGDSFVNVWFQYGTSASYGYTTSQQTLASIGGSSQMITGLSPNTTYHFRAAAQNSNSGTVYGQDQTFYTTAATYNSNVLSASQTGANLSSGNLVQTNYVSASPSDVLMFKIILQAIGGQDVHNVFVRDVLPANLVYYNNLLVTGANYTGGSYGNIASGINIGTIPANQSAIITYQAQVASSQNFGQEATTLTNSAAITSNEMNTTSNVTINVSKTGISDATYVLTGLTNNFLTDSFFLPLMIILLGIYLYFSGMIFKFTEWVRTVGKR